MRASDIPAAARALELFLLDPQRGEAALLRRLGVDERLARDLAPVLPRGEELARACELGAAWALGRRSIDAATSWEPVVTSGDMTADGVDRMTAETLIGLVVGARATVRLFSAYVDRGGLDVLAVSLAAASRRGVSVSIGFAASGDKSNATAPFRERLEGDGDPTMIRIVGIPNTRPFPHVKLLAADGERAYIGSANLTWPALTSNVEFGALVSGHHVGAFERCFDRLVELEDAEEGGPDGDQA